jgi:hypothetical protein
VLFRRSGERRFNGVLSASRICSAKPLDTFSKVGKAERLSKIRMNLHPIIFDKPLWNGRRRQKLSTAGFDGKEQSKSTVYQLSLKQATIISRGFDKFFIESQYKIK